MHTDSLICCRLQHAHTCLNKAGKRISVSSSAIRISPSSTSCTTLRRCSNAAACSAASKFSGQPALLLLGSTSRRWQPCSLCKRLGSFQMPGASCSTTSQETTARTHSAASSPSLKQQQYGSPAVRPSSLHNTSASDECCLVHTSSDLSIKSVLCISLDR